MTQKELKAWKEYSDAVDAFNEEYSIRETNHNTIVQLAVDKTIENFYEWQIGKLKL